MLKSMTAYGRATLHTQKGHFIIEIQSVNRKFLEVNISLPKELMRFDGEIRKWLIPYVARGQVTIKIFVSFEETVPITVRPNIPLAKQVKLAWNTIAQELNLEVDQVELSLFTHIKEILLFEEDFQEEDSYEQPLKQVLELALEQFSARKVQEGAILQADILGRVEKMGSWIYLIEQRASHAPKKYQEKLIARLEELFPGKIDNEERILREVAVFAEKMDITEEITRFSSHLIHFEELIRSDHSQIGKTLEFMLQELHREINTIGSKSSDLEISRHVINIKSELERIREQIQNIE